MKKITLALLLTICLIIFCNAQQSNKDYNSPYSKIADMLDSKTPLSIRRVVFLTEWAYFNGNLDYKKKK